MSQEAKTLGYWARSFQLSTDLDERAYCRCRARAWAAAIISGAAYQSE